MKKALLILVLLGLAATGYFVWSARAAREASQPEYTTAKATRGDVTQVVTATGNLDAVISVDVGSQISGQIKKLYADYNTPVKEGQKLVELDPSNYQQAVRQAEADVASADANHSLAELNAKRIADLFAKSLVTQQDNDQAQVQLKQARATLLIKQAVLENAKVNLSRCTIYSPIDGIVISKQTEEGKTVAASMNVPVLFTIANDLTKMQITAAVAEADIGAVNEGQQATFTVDAFPNRTFHGVITQVRNAPQNSNNVVTYQTIISVDNPDLKLRPGMTANVSIIVAKRDNVVRVPNAALRVRMPEEIKVVQASVAAKPGAPATSAGSPQPAGPRIAAGGGREGGGFRRFFGPDAKPEDREKMREIMVEVGYERGSGPPSPEQREQIRKLMVERGLITAEEAEAAATRSAGRQNAGDQPVYVTRTVYRLPGGNKLATPEAVTVKVGITDGLQSEIAEGLSEGDTILTSVYLPSAQTRPTSNPFGPQRRF